MKREEFKKMFMTEEIKSQILDYHESDKLKIVVKIDSLYNASLNKYRPSLQQATGEYYYQYCSKVETVKKQGLDEMKNKKWGEIIEVAKGKSKLIKFLLEEMKIPCKIEYQVISSSINVNGEPHHFNSYVFFEFDIENAYCYFGAQYKRKVFLFFDEGVLTIKYPPYNLKDSVMNIGVFPEYQRLTIVED